MKKTKLIHFNLIYPINVFGVMFVMKKFFSIMIHHSSKQSLFSSVLFIRIRLRNLRLSFVDRSIDSSRIVNQSINNSVQVNVLNLIEQKISSTPINHNKFQKCFELEHCDMNDLTRGFLLLIDWSLICLFFSSGTSGLYNLDKTCYMNWGLQVLSNW